MAASTRPRSERSSEPAAGYICHCTFVVSARFRRSLGRSAWCRATCAHASPSRSVSRRTLPRGSACAAYSPASSTSSHNMRSGVTPAGRFGAPDAGSVGMPSTTVSAWARAWSRAPVVVAVAPSGGSVGSGIPSPHYLSIDRKVQLGGRRRRQRAPPGPSARHQRRAGRRTRARRSSTSPPNSSSTAATPLPGTREIAAAVGLRQASLFHYFARKEDLFAELLDRTVSPALEATAWLMGHPGPPEVRLYALAHHDVMNLCRSRHNIAALQLLPEARDARFADFWAKRAQLRGRYRRLIKEADRAGRVVDQPIEMSTDLVFGAVEATMTWSSSRRASPERTAGAVASAAVRGVLARPPSPDALHTAASRLRRAT